MNMETRTAGGDPSCQLGQSVNAVSPIGQLATSAKGVSPRCTRLRVNETPQAISTR